ncbi:hypothetical protein Peur_052605 [Populus x canadensis]
MIRSGTLCFGWTGTPTVLSSLDCWWRFPRSVGNLVAVKESRLEREAMAVTVGLPTSCDVWLALEHVFSHGSKTHEICLKNELQLMKKGSWSVAEFP